MKKSFLVVFLIVYSTHAQISTDFKNTPLEQVLQEISTSHDIIFSFSHELVKNKLITLSVINVSLDEIIASLKKQTKLDFRKISDRQVIVSTPDTKVEVCGYLYNETTNTPLPYASVFIESTSSGTITDEAGFFQLGFIEEERKIKIQYVGYMDRQMPVADFKKSGCPKIPLLAVATSLEEVLIVEYITKGLGKNIDGSLMLTNEDLGILPGQTEADVLRSTQLIPGINSPDETASGIQIRGGSSDQNLILWDDIRMYNTGHFFGLISAFNPNVIRGARVIRSGADPKYGDRVSGVIDIFSDREIPEKFNGGIGVNGTHGDFFLKTPVGEKVGLVISGRRAYTDILQTRTYEAYFDKIFQNTKIVADTGLTDSEEEKLEGRVKDDSFFFYDTTVKVIVDISENDKILVSGIYTNNKLAFEIADDEDLLTDDLKITNEGASFSWKGTKGNRITHSLKGFYSQHTSDYLYTGQEELEIEEESIRKNTVKDIGADLSIIYKLNKANATTLGYQVSTNEVFYDITRDSEFESPISTSDLVKNTANTFYGNHTFSPINKSYINVGGRLSHYSVVDKFYFEPRLNIEYPLSTSLRVKATGELRYQPISQLVEFEDTQLRVENSLWIHSDANKIPVLQSTQFSGGFLFSKNDWNLEIDGYYKNIEGLTSLTNGFNNISVELSTGESKIIGMDILLKKRFDNFRTWIGYTFNDIVYTFPFDEEPITFPGNNDITHNFRISNTLELGHWEFSLGWFWRTGAPFTDASPDVENEEIDFDIPNAKRLPSYHRLDASMIYTFNFNKNNNWRGQLGVSLLNLYDRQIPLSVSYRLDENPDTEALELDILRQESLGLTPNITFKMFF